MLGGRRVVCGGCGGCWVVAVRSVVVVMGGRGGAPAPLVRCEGGEDTLWWSWGGASTIGEV